MAILRRKDEGGFTLVELVIAVVLLGIVAAAAMQAFRFISVQGVNVSERAFATQKSIQMMEELRGLVETTGGQVNVLDNYDTGSTFKYTLSTRSEVNGAPGVADPGDNPSDPLSGNPSSNAFNNGKYKRSIRVTPVVNEGFSRRVYVRVYRASDGEVLAETVSILRTLQGQFSPTQVFDIFVLELENVPGWWVSLSSLRPTFNNVISDIKLRNPGLDFRTHYITRLAYGRDPYYRPFINSDASPTNATAPSKVYFLPGNIDGSFIYYDHNAIQGMLSVGGYFINPTTGTAPSDGTAYPYSLADQYNSAVRFPDEVRMFGEHYDAAVAAGQTPPEVSLRMLLDRLNSPIGTGPDGAYDYRNAIVINLHGELMPMPPIRNYSDPAKRPEAATLPEQEVRAVSHPESLFYFSGSAVNLRVYSFVSDPTSFVDTAKQPDMTVCVVSTNILNTTVQTALGVTGSIRLMQGDSTLPYSWRDAVPGVDYNLTLDSSTRTVITLHNSPLRSPLNANKSGLDPNQQLYGLEYIPCPIENPPAFQETTALLNHRDLADVSSSTVPKNTARWVIKLPAALLPDGVTTFETRIGADFTTGSAGNEPANLSRTYVWLGLSPAVVPLSEQSQFQGDPRYNPYVDVKSKKRFNWFFRSDIKLTDYPGYTWDDGTTLIGQKFGPGGDDSMGLVQDVPRFWELLRTGLLNSTGLLNNIAGWSFYYLGIGGEMGSDSNNFFGAGLPIVGSPWQPNNASVQNVDEVSKWSAATQSQLIAHATNGNGSNTDWFGVSWIGELYPAEASVLWTASGNLPVGNAAGLTAGRYFRAIYGHSDLNMYGHDLGQVFPTSVQPMKEPGPNGPRSFFNGQLSGQPATYFNNDNGGSNPNIATLTSSGTEVGQSFSFTFASPLTDTNNKHRHFQLDGSGSAPLERSQNSYSVQRATLSLVESYYTSNLGANFSAGGLVKIAGTGGRIAYVQPNGLSPETDFGSAEIGKMSVMNLLRSFLTAGNPVQGVVPQVPLLTISAPSATQEFASTTTVINVTWTAPWTRWDNLPYTSAYGVAFTTTTALTYNVKVSQDNGVTWRCASDITLPQTSIGVNDPACIPAATAPFPWPVPVASYPGGDYLLRVEAFRSARGLNYTFHERRVALKR